MDSSEKSSSSVSSRIDLDQISEEALLNTRICDLPIKIEGTWLAECINELYQELAAKEILFRPECYLADEWLTPEGETCIGIPFYLAHPTLIRLEKKVMIDAEGETKNWCMKLLRHEAGHAICYAYAFNKLKQWRKIFGRSDVEYADTYKYRPYSKNYVRHLDGFYAQYHPDEDFVETFSVWLTPDIDWKTKYKGWKALAKLEYLDFLMTGVKNKPPLVKSSQKFWRFSTLRQTLKHYYKNKRYVLAEEFPDFHDAFLKKVFSSEAPAAANVLKANQIISKYRRNILKSVSRSCGEKKYIINDLLTIIQKRCKDLKLFGSGDEAIDCINLTAHVTALMTNYFHTGRFRAKDPRKKK